MARENIDLQAIILGAFIYYIYNIHTLLYNLYVICVI